MENNDTQDQDIEVLTPTIVPDVSSEWGTIRSTQIVDEMERSYLDYAMSVIVSRALPDVRDGLKPVHRRILFAMKEMGMTHKSPYKKSARIVGEVLGKYHPHGDTAVYQTMVRLAQDFNMRYPLVDGQGNFGSIDGDSAAAMRYTEARLAKITDSILEDIDKDTVDFADNFDASLKEPTVLPAKLPNLLLMGSDGIAVGMATKIPPHNMREIAAAVVALIDSTVVVNTTDISKIENIENAPYKELIGDINPEITIEGLLEHIKGPDFPTGGVIYDQNEIAKMYLTGKASIVNRGVAEIVERKTGKFQILITEIPYQVNKTKLITHIAELVKKKKIEGISDLRDESDRKGMTIAIDLKRDAKPKSLLNQLYKYTELQSSFPANIVALTSDGTPHLLNLKQILTEYLVHRQGVVIRRSQYDLKSDKARAHILEGLLKALDHIDEIIKTIKESPDVDQARINLVTKFGLSEIQASAILEMQLRRLAALERQKLEAEYKELISHIEFLTSILKDPKNVLQIIKDEVKELSANYGDDRKTKVIKSAVDQFSEEDLIANEETIVTITSTGYVKRLPPDTFKTQHRGGKGISGMSLKESDEIHLLTYANTHDHLLVFTDKGRVFSLKVWELPEASRVAKGQAIVNLINIDTDEKIQSILPLTSEAAKDNQSYLFFTTRRGTVKRTLLAKYANIKSNGLIAIKLEDKDNLVWVNQTSGKDHILLATHEGKSIRFVETDVRATDRDTMGVRGILLKPEDYVIGMEMFSPVNPNAANKKSFRDLLTVNTKGMGKRTDIEEYPVQNRGGQGLKVSDVTEKTGKIVGAMLVNENSEDLLITTTMAQAIKLPIRNIPRLQRPTQGVILMRFAKTGDSVAAVTVIAKTEEEVK